jgi:hypothetical protein
MAELYPQRDRVALIGAAPVSNGSVAAVSAMAPAASAGEMTCTTDFIIAAMHDDALDAVAGCLAQETPPLSLDQSLGQGKADRRTVLSRRSMPTLSRRRYDAH